MCLNLELKDGIRRNLDKSNTGVVSRAAWRTYFARFVTSHHNSMKPFMVATSTGGSPSAWSSASSGGSSLLNNFTTSASNIFSSSTPPVMQVMRKSFSGASGGEFSDGIASDGDFESGLPLPSSTSQHFFGGSQYLICPTVGQRVVYLWKNERSELPVGMAVGTMPRELRDKGVPMQQWNQAVQQLASVPAKACCCPPVLYCLYFIGLLALLFTICFPILMCCPFGYCTDMWTYHVRWWLRRWNREFKGYGIYMKVQRIGTVFYLSIALTPEESRKLEDEPKLVRGDSMVNQKPESGAACPFMLPIP